MQQLDRSAAAHGFAHRLAMVVAVATGLFVLIIPVCRPGMSAVAFTGMSPTAVAAHRSTPGGGVAQTSTAGPVLHALSFAGSSATPISGRPTGSLPGPGTSMLACITVLMTVLAAIARLRVHRSTGGASPANLPAPQLITRCPRRATLAELCVLRT